MKPDEVLEELAGLGLVDAECLSRGKLPWVFVVSGLTVTLSRAHEHEAMKVEARGRCGSVSLGVRAERGVRLSVSTAATIQQVVGVFCNVAPPQRAGLEVREVAGRRLYLVRDVGAPRCLLVLATTGDAALVLACRVWGLECELVADEATEAESGRHEEILTGRGTLPAADVLSMLARIG